MLQSEGVKQFGLHALLASNSTDAAYYPTIARMLFKLAVEAHETHGRGLLHDQPLRRRGHPLPPAAVARPTSRRSPTTCAGLYERMIAPHGHGHVHIASELGALHDRPARLPGGHGHPRKAHLQGVYRPGRLRRQPHAPGDVRRLPPHHHRRQGRRCPATTSTTSSVPCAKTTTSSPSTARCRTSTSAIWWSSTIPARTATPWATTTTASCVRPKCCCTRTARFQLIRRAETPLDYFATIDGSPYFESHQRRDRILEFTDLKSLIAKTEV